MTHDGPAAGVPPIYVSAADGTLFSCVPHTGSVSATQSKWKLIDATGLEYVGPPYAREQSLDDVQRMVAEWWESQHLTTQRMSDESRPRGRSSGPTVVVTTEDGTVFHCTPYETVGPDTQRQARWKLVEPGGVEYAGPDYDGFTSQADIRRMVAEWWEAQKARGRAGIDALGRPPIGGEA